MMRVFDVMIETTREIVQVESKLFPFSQDKFLSTVSGAEPPIVAARQQILSLISDNMATPAKVGNPKRAPLRPLPCLVAHYTAAHSASTRHVTPRGALVCLCRGVAWRSLRRMP